MLDQLIAKLPMEFEPPTKIQRVEIPSESSQQLTFDVTLEQAGAIQSVRDVLGPYRINKV